MRVAPVLLALVVAVIVAPASAGAAGSPATVLSADSLLAALVDPSSAAVPLPQGTRVVEFSSHDRLGGNLDGGSYDAAGASLQQPGTFLYREGSAAVLLDERGPGCLARMWFTASAGVQGDVSPWGRIQMFFDGEASPRFDFAAADFFAGRTAMFPKPLVGDNADSSGGNYSYVPFCFARSLKLRTTQTPPSFVGWYQLDVLRAPLGTAVETFDPAHFSGEMFETAAQTLGASPSRAANVDVSASLIPGQSRAVANIQGFGSIRYLRLSLAPFDIDTLQATTLKVFADEASVPQISVPLGDLFGDGMDVRDIRALGFGMSPATQSGYFAFAIPFSKRVTVELQAKRSIHVRFEAWTGPPIPGAWTLYGQRREETTRLGRDYKVLDADGSGRMVSRVLDVLFGGPGRADQYYLEGNERVYVDGLRTPAIEGTGTEDSSNGAFYFDHGPFALPTHGAGALLGEPGDSSGRSQYRVYGYDGPVWWRSIDFGQQHGGYDDNPGEVVANTTFSYRSDQRLDRSDGVNFAGLADAGAVQQTTRTEYFEGTQDGTLPVPPTTAAPSSYRAPTPDPSSKAVKLTGISFGGPVSVKLRVDPANRGMLLRRVLDAKGPNPSNVEVQIDGVDVGRWWVPYTNPAKRWLEDDFQVPAAYANGKSLVTVTLTPLTAEPETAYSLESWSYVPPAFIDAPGIRELEDAPWVPAAVVLLVLAGLGTTGLAWRWRTAVPTRRRSEPELGVMLKRLPSGVWDGGARRFATLESPRRFRWPPSAV